MRLVTFDNCGSPTPGVRLGDRVHDLSWFAPSLELVVELMADGLDTPTGVERAPSLPLGEVTLLPPLLQPGKIVCVGLNYASHAAETGAQLPDFPVLFPRWPNSLVGHGGALVVPSVSEQLDYEGELVAVIGRGGRHIPRDAALGHVFGYPIFNDASVRDVQFRTSQFTPGKTFDGTGGFGPELVTADELPPGGAGLRLTTTVGEEVLQDATTDQMLFDVAHLVHLVSGVMTLDPGDVIVTGTPEGVGAARTPQRWLRPGETVEVTIEGIGTLRNAVVAEG
jgi:2-keto-4-pentenoate hydratase/2-oxohepta-3-ene-1,7-dioic acid hydratase in catechol pathway